VTWRAAILRGGVTRAPLLAFLLPWRGMNGLATLFIYGAIVVRKDRRGIHDLVADTVVIEDPPKDPRTH
jgi:uncharacterized RDD family membrane protein YckC